MSLTIGIDIGGTKVLGGVVDTSGKIIATARRDTPIEGGRALTETIAAVANELKSAHRIEAVGISAAGFISADRKTILATPNIKGWNGVALEKELVELIGTRVVVENDANAAAWGEAEFGAGLGVSHMIMVTVGTGVGGGIVINRNIYRGTFGMGAELGHMRLVPGGVLCGCGALGCVEQYASGTALLRFAQEGSETAGARRLIEIAGDVSSIKGSHITQGAREDDGYCIALFEKLGNYLGEALASYAAILDPELIVIGGGVIDAGDLLLTPARKAFEKHLPFSAARPKADIIAAQLGNDAGLVGAADLARY